MLRRHVVRAGEHLSWIADEYGLANDDAIWSHADNAALKTQRRSPYVLAPGDSVAIPEVDTKEVVVATDRPYVFVVNRTVLKLGLRLLDCQGQPVDGASCTLTVDGKTSSLTSDAAGVVRAPIPRGTRSATFEHGGVSYELGVGNLDPISEMSGLRARLDALGYGTGEPGDVDAAELRFAIELFQRDRGLAVDGEVTPALRDAVEKAFGC